MNKKKDLKKGSIIIQEMEQSLLEALGIGSWEEMELFEKENIYFHLLSGFRITLMILIGLLMVLRST